MMRILTAKHEGAASYQLTKDEFFFIKDQLDHAMHLIYAHEKMMVNAGEIKKYKLWQTRFARAKKTIQACDKMLHVSQIQKYDMNINQVITTQIYQMEREASQLLLRLAQHLKAIIGLGDGKELRKFMEELESASLEGELVAEEAETRSGTAQSSSSQPPSSGYTFEDD